MTSTITLFGRHTIFSPVLDIFPVLTHSSSGQLASATRAVPFSITSIFVPLLIGKTPSLSSGYSATVAPLIETITVAPSSLFASIMKNEATPAISRVTTKITVNRVFAMLLKVSSADEVALVYAFYGANLAACAAVGTFFIIYRSKIIHYVNGIVRTILFALATRNTTVLACLARYSALIVA